MDKMEKYKRLKDEFKSAEALHRFEATIMVGQTAVYLVATGTLFDVLINSSQNHSDFDKYCITIFGLFLSLMYFVIISRCGNNLRGARRRATELGRVIDFELYSSSYRASKNRLFVGVNMTKAVCVVGGLWWLGMFYKIIF